jgi:hypothetical protein
MRWFPARFPIPARNSSDSAGSPQSAKRAGGGDSICCARPNPCNYGHSPSPLSHEKDYRLTLTVRPDMLMEDFWKGFNDDAYG